MKIEEIKTYRCSDGSVFDSKDVAEAHEADLKDPNYMLIKRIEELEKKIQHLEAENLKRVAEIEAAKRPYGILNKDCSSPWIPKVYYGSFQNDSKLPKVYYGSFQNDSDIIDKIADFFTDDKGDNK